MENYSSSLTGQQIDDAVSYILNNSDNLDIIKSYLTENKKDSIDNLLEYLTERQEKINNIISYLTEEENTEIETEANEENTETEVKPEIKKTKKEKIIDDIIEYLNKIGEDNSNRREKIDGIINKTIENQNWNWDNIVEASKYLNDREDNALQNKMGKIDNIIEYLDTEKQENITNTIENHFKKIEIKTYTITIPSNAWKGQNKDTPIKWCTLENENISIIDEQNNTVAKNNIIKKENFINCYIYKSGLATILYVSPWYNNEIIFYGIPSGDNTDILTLKVISIE